MSLKHEDLEGNILPDVSIDEFEPKAGSTKQVIVVAFYLKDEGPAADLNRFIQRGFIETLDVEESPSTDEDGRYLVFVEFERDPEFFEKFHNLLSDIENVSGSHTWKIKPYLSDQSFDLTDNRWKKYIMVNPDEYVSKKDFGDKMFESNVRDFFQNTLIKGLTFENNTVTITSNVGKIVAEVVDTGDYDTVVGRNFLSESAFVMESTPQEARVLQNILGNCQVIQLGNYLFVSNNENVMLLQNTHISHR